MGESKLRSLESIPNNSKPGGELFVTNYLLVTGIF
jgi:hypothetical protein